MCNSSDTPSQNELASLITNGLLWILAALYYLNGCQNKKNLKEAREVQHIISAILVGCGQGKFSHWENILEIPMFIHFLLRDKLPGA